MRSETDHLTLEAATGTRRLTRAELRRVLESVAHAGFDPIHAETARGDLVGMDWQGQQLKASDRIPPAVRHYLHHAVRLQEWPAGTALAEYLESIEHIIRAPSSGVLTSRYQGAWQLGIVRRTRELRGPHGFDWVLIEYRVALGHWVTAYQLARGLLELRHARRSEMRWIRRPR